MRIRDSESFCIYNSSYTKALAQIMSHFEPREREDTSGGHAAVESSKAWRAQLQETVDQACLLWDSTQPDGVSLLSYAR